MKSFARVTKLSNVGGRADYISNPTRQEKILATSEAVDWKPYQEFEGNNQRSSAKNNEGREVIISLPNEWAKLPPAELATRANEIALVAVGKSTDQQWAVHWNKSYTNLHLHVVFSERTREMSSGTWDRDIYLTADGKVARKKADRATAPDGSTLPPVHRKGEAKEGGFSAKDKTYKQRSWVADMKKAVAEKFVERWGVDIENPDHLHQFHEGKGKEAPAIRAKNEVIKGNNQRLKDLEALGLDVNIKFVPALKQFFAEKQITVLHLVESRVNLTRFASPAGAKRKLAETAKHWQAQMQLHSQQRLDQPEQAPEAPPFSALVTAQTNYYREAFAMADKRKPINPATQEAPARLTEAVTALKTALEATRKAWGEVYRYNGLQGVLHRSDKKEAQSYYYQKQKSVQNCLDRIENLGVSLYFGNDKLTPTTVTMDGYSHNFEKRIAYEQSQLENKARAERTNALPADALKGSPDRLEATRTAFLAELKKIPPEQKDTARAVLLASVGDLKQGYAYADSKAVLTVRELSSKHLPSPQAIKEKNTRGSSRSER